jgi:hypothetical protein
MTAKDVADRALLLSDVLELTGEIRTVHGGAGHFAQLTR